MRFQLTRWYNPLILFFFLFLSACGFDLTITEQSLTNDSPIIFDFIKESNSAIWHNEIETIKINSITTPSKDFVGIANNNLSIKFSPQTYISRTFIRGAYQIDSQDAISRKILEGSLQFTGYLTLDHQLENDEKLNIHLYQFDGNELTSLFSKPLTKTYSQQTVSIDETVYPEIDSSIFIIAIDAENISSPIAVHWEKAQIQ